MELADILPKLQDWFPVEDHRERQIKGGGRWYYLPHQVIRDRLNELCPSDWSTAYDGPHVVDGEPIYHCRLTICGITRTGIGDKSNEPSPYGTSAQRAFRKAFTDAAEQFGIGAYLDDQTSEKTKRNFIKYMQSQGNGKAASIYQENQRLERGDVKQPSDPPSRPFGQPDMDAATEPKTTKKAAKPKATPEGVASAASEIVQAALINAAQRKRLYEIATQEGKYTDHGFRRLVEGRGYASSKEITIDTYEELCDRARNPELAVFYNQESPVPVS